MSARRRVISEKPGYALGIDLGTSGVKAGLLNLSTLEPDFLSLREYEGSPEQAAEILWGQAVEAIREAAARLGSQGTVRAIGLSGQMHGAVLYGADGDLLAPLITWQDRKWSPEAVVAQIKRLMGAQSYPELGTEIASGYSGAILYGIKVSAPDLFRRIAHFVLPADFLRGKLLGTVDPATDQTNAFGTGLFDTQSTRWHTDLIETLQLPLDIFPAVHGSSQIAGGLSAEIAARLGLRAGIPVVYGGGDNQMSMLGSALAGPGSPLLVNIGTAAQISKVVAEFVRYPGTDTRSFFNGAFAVVGTSLGGGGSYRGLREQVRQSGGVGLDFAELDRLAEGVPPGADGLVFCTGPTRQNPGRRGGFLGKRDRAGSVAHRARAVLEGVLMDLYPAYEVMEPDDRCGFILGAGKGLQHSRPWPRIAASLFGKPLRVSGFENAVCGAALIAAYGVGAVGGLEDAAVRIKTGAEIASDPQEARYYRQEFVPYWRKTVLDV